MNYPNTILNRDFCKEKEMISSQQICEFQRNVVDEPNPADT